MSVLLSTPVLSTALSSPPTAASRGQQLGQDPSQQPLREASPEQSLYNDVAPKEPVSGQGAYRLTLGQYSHQYQDFTYTHLNGQSTKSTYTESFSVQTFEVQQTQVAAVESSPAMLEGASNILGFIAQRIEQAVVEGASDEEIEELLQQGLEGFKQGYGEAMDILAGSGDINEEVDAAVSMLYKQVETGIEQLRQDILGEVDADSDTGINTVEAVSRAPDSPASKPQAYELFSADNSADRQAQLAATVSGFAEQNASTIDALIESLDAPYAAVDYSRQHSFSFELTTADGDTVRIQADSASAFSGEYESTSVYASSSESSSSNSRFSFSVDGDIDQDEAIAIEHLMDQVMSLADTFYDGDVQSAYQAAMELGYDRTEITGYSLNLKQVETYSVAQAYQQFAPVDHHVSGELLDIFDPIGRYAKDILESLNQPENFEQFNYLQLLEQVSEQVDAQVSVAGDYRFSDSVKDILS